VSDHAGSSAGVYEQKLKNIKRIANQNADIHSCEADRLARWNGWLTAGALLFSAFLLLFSLVSEDFIQRTIGLTPDAYKWVFALLAFLTFGATLLQMALQPGAAAVLHRRAVSHYARAKHQIDLSLRATESLTKEAIEVLLERYLDDTDLPKIPEHRFNKLKRKHLIKIAVRTSLSRNPHRPIRSIKRELARSSVRDETPKVEPN